ncbi:MAG TPA: response regulator [Candidatus Cloacimonadota bacterium]|jgi:DNA-binding NtrC family response regulator|nr:response regulator [Candidatus Cloacimonadota bacterium]MDD2596587.1 response regulator [Candidatus Cloacimonadota bacterium]MDD4099794.1 response regulator [Candidatus Cloacimonadota bacterium]MDD4805905.1 response regulator [Candidatus Cloacimonadota bacterium]HNQ44380.1 response regulator [Candidatus Cloacimonadota bacterium]
MTKVICIVDDEDELVANLKIEIQELRPKWEVHTFCDGLKALQMIMSGKVDLVLTDIAMPDMDGYELFWRVKDYDDKIPVIMMTGFGYDPNHVLVRAKVDGLKDVLFKPFDVEKLVELIDQKLLQSGGQE